MGSIRLVLFRFGRLTCVFQFGIGYTSVVNSFEAFNQNLLGLADITERNGTVREVTVVYLVINQSVDEATDALFRVFGK